MRGIERYPCFAVSAYGRNEVKTAHRTGVIQTSAVRIRNVWSPTRGRPRPLRRARSRAARERRGRDGDARHVWRSWKEFDTKTTIGTIEMVIRITAIAEP